MPQIRVHDLKVTVQGVHQHVSSEETEGDHGLPKQIRDGKGLRCPPKPATPVKIL